MSISWFLGMWTTRTLRTLLAPPANGRRDSTHVAVKSRRRRGPVPVHDVALGDEVRAPDRVEDLIAGEHSPTATGEQVEEALLDPRGAAGDDDGPREQLLWRERHREDVVGAHRG
jgi:hypothetical protein